MLESSGNDIISSLNNSIIPSLNEIFSFELVFYEGNLIKMGLFLWGSKFTC